MSLLRLRVTNECPPDEFRYVHPEDGHTTRANVRADWLAKILKHKRDNGYDVPADWKEMAEDQLARSLPPGWSFYEDGSQPDTFLDRRTPVEDVMNGTRVLLAFAQAGCQIVPQAEAERRGQICARCYARETVRGCSPCVGLANLVAEVCGSGTTSADSILEDKVCLVCHCSARANLWIPVEVSKAGVTPEMMRNFPAFCWKRQGIEALASST